MHCMNTCPVCSGDKRKCECTARKRKRPATKQAPPPPEEESESDEESEEEEEDHAKLYKQLLSRYELVAKAYRETKEQNGRMGIEVREY